ncbi:uncharacterized protein LOC125578042 [Brassica napus]|uniref:uncharacterized protein LOC125578042 n=1 Tax=Brassica napus TaxID=3708 RepID=UPI002078D57D|nr:uncharacterized protein LOC125578042 [Brassica napus]
MTRQELGPLHLLSGPSGPRDLRIPLDATVSQAVTNDHWNLPSARSEYAITLQIILSTLPVPSATYGCDTYLWRTSSGAFGNSFSSKVTWERMRVPIPLVQWHSVAWFREEITRCSFIAWTAFLRRLPTRDRFLATPPATLDAVVVLCQHFPGPHARRAVAVMKLLNQVIIYNIWRERNARVFTGVSSTQEAVFRVVDRTVRDRLLALSRPTVSAPPPSLLELYFWFISPYS